MNTEIKFIDLCAKALLKKREEELKGLKENFSEFVTEIVERSLPEVIRIAFEMYPEYFWTHSRIAVKTEPLGYKIVLLLKSLPLSHSVRYKNNWVYIPNELYQEESTLKDFLLEEENLKKEIALLKSGERFIRLSEMVKTFPELESVANKLTAFISSADSDAVFDEIYKELTS